MFLGLAKQGLAIERARRIWEVQLGRKVYRGLLCGKRDNLSR